MVANQYDGLMSIGASETKMLHVYTCDPDKTIVTEKK